MCRAIFATAIALLVAMPIFAASEWQEFTHPQIGFKLRYPQGWTALASDPFAATAVTVTGPAVAGVPDYVLTVTVSTVQVPARTTVDEYDRETDLTHQRLLDGYRRRLDYPTELDGLPAIVRMSTWRWNQLEVFQVELLAVLGSRGFVVTGTTFSSSAHLHDETQLLLSIIRTFRPRGALVQLGITQAHTASDPSLWL